MKVYRHIRRDAIILNLHVNSFLAWVACDLMGFLIIIGDLSFFRIGAVLSCLFGIYYMLLKMQNMDVDSLMKVIPKVIINKPWHKKQQ